MNMPDGASLCSLPPEGGELRERLVRKDQRGLQGRQRLRAAGRR